MLVNAVGSVNADEARTGIGGWLLVLCLLLLVGHPLVVGLAVSRLFDSIAILGVRLALLLAARMLGTAFGVGAGIALLKQRAIGVAMAKASLTMSAMIDVLVLTTPWFPTSRGPGEAPLLVAATIGYYGAWVLYLYRSSRVSLTFRDR
jgi:hypothetical protein